MLDVLRGNTANLKPEQHSVVPKQPIVPNSNFLKKERFKPTLKSLEGVLLDSGW